MDPEKPEVFKENRSELGKYSGIPPKNAASCPLKQVYAAGQSPTAKRENVRRILLDDLATRSDED